MPEAIHLSCLCNRSAVPLLDESQLVYVLTELTPDPALADQRMPLNFALVLDRSGSMEGHKLRSLKKAVNRIIDRLAADDILSLITFETRCQLLAEAQLAQDKVALKYLVDQIVPGGSTVMAPAIGEAIRQVSTHNAPDRVSRIILLTDGEATDPEDHSRREADQAGALGLPLIALGFGMDWNEDFLCELADRSLLLPPGTHGGTVEFIPTPTMAVKTFWQVFQSMHVVAQNVFTKIHLAQGIEARRVWQVKPAIRDISPSAIQAGAVIVHCSDLEQGGAAFLCELILPPRPEGTVRIAKTEATFDLPGAAPEGLAADLVLHYTQDLPRLEQLDSRVMNIVEKVQAFKLQQQALIEAEAGEIGSATHKLRTAATILLSQGDHELAEQIAQAADHLETNGTISNAGKKTIKLTSRKTVMLSPPDADAQDLIED
jgi:Ca-activated chloride channel family protein